MVSRKKIYKNVFETLGRESEIMNLGYFVDWFIGVNDVETILKELNVLFLKFKSEVYAQTPNFKKNHKIVLFFSFKNYNLE